MEIATWGTVLQNVTPNQGPTPLPLGDYNLKVLMGRGQTASTGKEMISVQFEVIDGPCASRKTWHNWVMPDLKGDPEKAATSLGYFLGDMEIFGLPKDWFVQTLGGQAINKQTCDYIAQQLIGRTACATVTEQRNDKSRRNIGGFRALDPTLASMPAPGGPPQQQNGFPAPQGFPQPGQAPMQQGSPFGQAPPPAYGPPPMAPQSQPPMQQPQAPAPYQPGAMPQGPPPQQPPAYGPPPQQAPAYQPPPQQYSPAQQPNIPGQQQAPNVAPAQQAFQAPPQAPEAQQMPAPSVPTPGQPPLPQGFPGAPVQPPAVNF
jgi:hypothetical protein